ncbi:hypothetical protein PTH_2129 [Pelotomaculum thermopropionicum SI]|uniref:Uncharacterized protein n=1 Tax=Pelotomaculum thermopropionicum (strain DSM 13744 / JCM 10971 / SI) TaxID=370438 RepID=A5D0C1_PELTS|nr:hypothetical protein PTH_2129 [Pelotomaculum thermopropionicum SI]
MIEKELLSLLLQDFPESITFTIAAFALLSLKYDYKKILFISLLQTFTNLIRLLPIAFGMHTIILLITLTVYIRIFTKAKLSKILTSTVLLFVIMAAMQAIYAKPLLNLTNLSYEDVASSPVLRGLFCLPYELVFLGIAIFLNIHKKKSYSFKSTN